MNSAKKIIQKIDLNKLNHCLPLVMPEDKKMPVVKIEETPVKKTATDCNILRLDLFNFLTKNGDPEEILPMINEESKIKVLIKDEKITELFRRKDWRVMLEAYMKIPMIYTNSIKRERVRNFYECYQCLQGVKNN